MSKVLHTSAACHCKPYFKYKLLTATPVIRHSNPRTTSLVGLHLQLLFASLLSDQGCKHVRITDLQEMFHVWVTFFRLPLLQWCLAE